MPMLHPLFSPLGWPTLRWFLLLLLPRLADAAERKGIIRDPQGNPVFGTSVFLSIAEAREGGGGFRLPRYPASKALYAKKRSDK